MFPTIIQYRPGRFLLSPCNETYLRNKMSRAHLYIFVLPIAIKNTIKEILGIFSNSASILLPNKKLCLFSSVLIWIWKVFLSLHHLQLLRSLSFSNVYKVVFLYFQSMSHKTDKFEKKLTKSHQFHLIILRSWHREIHFSFKY